MIDAKAMPHLADIPRVQAERRPDDVAMWFEGRETTYSALEKTSNRIANGLIAAGVEPVARVAYLGKNLDSYYEILFGAAKARCAMTGLNNRLAAPELQFILSDSDAPILFVSRDFYDVIRAIKDDCPALKTIIAIEGDHADWPSYADWIAAQSSTPPGLTTVDDDDVIQLYTSGTTGRPKGVMLSNFNYRALMEETGQFPWASYEVGDAVMNAMPLFHVAGCNLGILALAQGAKTVVLREIDPRVIMDLVEEQKIAHAF